MIYPGTVPTLRSVISLNLPNLPPPDRAILLVRLLNLLSEQQELDLHAR